MRIGEWHGTFTEALADPETRLGAANDIRALIGKVILSPGDKRGEVHAVLHGDIMGILAFAQTTPDQGAPVVTTTRDASSRD